MSVQYGTLYSLCNEKICDLLELDVAQAVVEVLIAVVVGVVVVVVMVVVVVVVVIVCLGNIWICSLMFYLNTMWVLDDRMRV